MQYQQRPEQLSQQCLLPVTWTTTLYYHMDDRKGYHSCRHMQLHWTSSQTSARRFVRRPPTPGGTTTVTLQWVGANILSHLMSQQKQSSLPSACLGPPPQHTTPNLSRTPLLSSRSYKDLASSSKTTDRKPQPQAGLLRTMQLVKPQKPTTEDQAPCRRP